MVVLSATGGMTLKDENSSGGQSAQMAATSSTLSYRPHWIGAAVIVGILIFFGAASPVREGVAASFVVFFVAMVDPIALLAAILVGALVRPFAWRVGGAVAVGIALLILVTALSGQFPALFPLSRLAAPVAIALVTHAVVQAVRNNRSLKR